MGKQEGLIRFTGKVGNLSFYKTQDGYLVRKKNRLSRNRIKSDPAFARTRENASEFARAVRAGKLLRTAFQPLLLDVADNRVTSRLTGAMVKVVRADAINPRGNRKVINGEIPLLEGFEFNVNAQLEKVFQPLLTTSIDRSTGNMVVHVPAFSPDKMISAPDGATHFRLKAAGAAIDFQGKAYSMVTAESANLSLDNKMQESLQLSLTITPASVHPLFLIFGIEFLQIIKNGSSYPLTDEAFNAMAIVKADADPNRDPFTNTPGGNEEKTPVAVTPAPKEQELYHFTYSPMTRFDHADSVTYTSVATNWSYDGNSLNESITCDFTRDIHHLSTHTAEPATSASPMASCKTEATTHAHDDTHKSDPDQEERTISWLRRRNNTTQACHLHCRKTFLVPSRVYFSWDIKKEAALVLKSASSLNDPCPLIRQSSA